MNKIIIVKIATTFVFLLLLVIGCSNETSDEPLEVEANPDSHSESSEENKGRKDENEGLNKESYKTDLGNLNVWFGGEVKVEGDKIVVNGESNLLPDSRLRILLYEAFNPAIGTRSIDNKEIKVNEDGTFYAEIPKPDDYSEVLMRIEFRPGLQSSDIMETYGRDLEYGEGPFIYLDDRGRKNLAKAYVLLKNLEEHETHFIEEPEWNDRPDDYGNPNVWIEVVEVTNDHEYFYLHAKSNLLEGSIIRGFMTVEGNRNIFMTHDVKHVNPDGSINLQIKYRDLVEDMKIQLVFYPLSWLNVLEAYGEDGEYLEGDLVVTMDDGSKEIHKLIELDLPDISSPEDVDMTSAEEEIKMQVPDNLLFDFDESQVKSEAENTLDEIIVDLEKLEEGTVIHINGHTDSQGSADYNQDLSEQRAQSVYDYLKNNGDIDHLDILFKGYGETKPRASNDTEEGRSMNRRVEIVINPQE